MVREKFKQVENKARVFREKYGLAQSIVIGYLGSKYGVKGLEVLLKAAQKLVKDGQPFKLLITGNMTDNAYLMGLIETLGLNEYVVLTGYLPKDELIGHVGGRHFS